MQELETRVGARLLHRTTRKVSLTPDGEILLERLRDLDQVKLADVQLTYATIKAPKDGTVVNVVGNVGQNAAPGRTILTMTDPSDLFVRVFVPETAIGQVSVGRQATVTADSSTTTFQGTVSFVSNQAEFTPNNIDTADQRTKLVFAVRVRVDDPSGTLKSGMPVDVQLS